MPGTIDIGQKSIQWGDRETVEAAVRYNCDRLGLPVPIGYWPIWSGTGNTISDLSPKSNIGNGVALDWQNTTIGAGIRCDNNQYVAFEKKIGDYVTNKFSLVWVGTPAQLTEDLRRFFVGQYASSSTDYDFGLYIQSTYNASFYVKTASGVVSVDSSSIMSVGDICSIAGIYDSENLKIYFNGVLEGGPTSQTGNITNINGFRLGGVWGTTTYANIITNTLIVFDIALSTNQIALLHEQPYALLEQPRQVSFFVVGGDITFTVDNALHSHTLDSPAITQAHTLTTDDLSHTHTLDNTALTQAHNISVDNILHSHILDDTTLTQTHNLTPDDLSHTHTIGNVIITQKHILALANLLHNHILGNVTLTQVHNLIIDSLTHGHTMDNVSLFLANTLLVDNLLHGHSLDNITLTQKHTLGVDDLVHDHVIDNATLIQHLTLIVDSLLHGHNLDDVILGESFNGLIQWVEGEYPTQINSLFVDNLLHSHTINTTSLSQKHYLTPQGLIHGHSLDNITLTQKHTLGVDDLVHDHVIDNASLFTILEPIINFITKSRTINFITKSRTINFITKKKGS